MAAVRTRDRGAARGVARADRGRRGRRRPVRSRARGRRRRAGRGRRGRGARPRSSRPTWSAPPATGARSRSATRSCGAPSTTPRRRRGGSPRTSARPRRSRRAGPARRSARTTSRRYARAGRPRRRSSCSPRRRRPPRRTPRRPPRRAATRRRCGCCPTPTGSAAAALLGPLALAQGAAGRLEQARDTLDEVLRLLPPEPTAQRVQLSAAAATSEAMLGRTTRDAPARCSPPLEVDAARGPRACSSSRSPTSEYTRVDYAAMPDWSALAVRPRRARTSRRSAPPPRRWAGLARCCCGEPERGHRCIDAAHRAARRGRRRDDRRADRRRVPDRAGCLLAERPHDGLPVATRAIALARATRQDRVVPMLASAALDAQRAPPGARRRAAGRRDRGRERTAARARGPAAPGADDPGATSTGCAATAPTPRASGDGVRGGRRAARADRRRRSPRSATPPRSSSTRTRSAASAR